MTGATFGLPDMQDHLERLRCAYDECEVVYRTETRVILRLPSAYAGSPLIIKMWSRNDLMGRWRRLFHRTSADLEYRSLKLMRQLGLTVPQAYGSCAVLPPISGFTDALFMEDLGECELATDYLKNLIKSGEESQAVQFEDAVIDMAKRIIQSGRLDVDHGFANILVTPSGMPVRLDLELVRHVYWPRLFPSMYGMMLGRMIGMHAFAVQPDTKRTTVFARRSLDRLRPPRRALVKAFHYVRWMLDEQREGSKIDTRLSLPWDQFGHVSPDLCVVS
jgi:hypothetical protein